MEAVPLLGGSATGKETSAPTSATHTDQEDFTKTDLNQQRRVIYAGLSVLCTIAVLLVTLTALSTPGMYPPVLVFVPVMYASLLNTKTRFSSYRNSIPILFLCRIYCF